MENTTKSTRFLRSDSLSEKKFHNSKKLWIRDLENLVNNYKQQYRQCLENTKIVY